MRLLLLLISSALLIQEGLAQEGHPLVGTWHGNWGANAQNRIDVTLVMFWDGKVVTGMINPGPDATKLEIKAAVEMLFKVQVESVQVANRQGKQKRTGKFNGRRNHTKRAFVCLKPGQEINFSEEAK